ncbi:MAG: MmcQ/YjbR family DNA-binding protein [Christensenellales bacterium]|jgi:predicted DNA-binding protein (MmcQ/YjbR family)
MNRQELIGHISDIYGAEPDYPFPQDDETCVFRHGDNRKWFAIVMHIPYRTLGMARGGDTWIVNVKCDPLAVGSLRGQVGFRPAYHMNKDKWLTILLDGSAAREDVTALVAMSYDLTAAKRRTTKRKGDALHDDLY